MKDLHSKMIIILQTFIQFLISNWLLVSLSSLIAIYWYTTRNHNYWAKRGIKGPPAIPYWGNFFSLLTPFPLLYQRYVREYGKFFGVYQGQKPVLIIAEPELLKRILVKDFHIFRNRPQVQTGGDNHSPLSANLALVRDEEWKRIRSILTPMFTSHKLKNMESPMQSCVDSLIDSLSEKAKSCQSFDALSPMSNFTMDVISRCAFATDTNAHADQDNIFLKNAKGFFDFTLFKIILLTMVPSFLKNKLQKLKVNPFYQAGNEFFEKLTRHLIKERRNNKGKAYNDMLQLMVSAEHNVANLKKTFAEDLSGATDAHYLNSGNEELEREEKELKEIIGSKYLSEREIISNSLLFFLAGYETTASTLSYCLYELTVNPNVQQRLYNEIQQAKIDDPKLSYATLSKLNYLDAVLSETLRKYPPGLALERETTESYYFPELKLTLEKGQLINVPAYAMHHLEEYFPDPERFDPERFMPENRDKIMPYSYIPFGGGPRNCIGMRFALSEAKMGLGRIIERFQLIRTNETQDQLEIIPGMILLKTMPIKIGVKSRY